MLNPLHHKPYSHPLAYMESNSTLTTLELLARLIAVGTGVVVGIRYLLKEYFGFQKMKEGYESFGKSIKENAEDIAELKTDLTEKIKKVEDKHQAERAEILSECQKTNASVGIIANDLKWIMRALKIEAKDAN